MTAAGDDLLSLDQVADELGSDFDSVYTAVRAGDLLGVWVPDHGAWYVRRSTLDSYKASQS